MYNRLTALGQTGHDNMWDTDVARQGREGQSRFCTKTNGPKEYMDTQRKAAGIGGFWTGN